MYQQYPSSGPVPEPQPPPAPNSVQTAVKFMYAGAALSFVELVVFLATLHGLKSAIHKADPKLTATQLHNAEVFFVVSQVIVAVIAIALWLWMARANAAGKNYARIVATVLFGLGTLLLLVSQIRVHAGLGLIFSALVWLAGLGAVIMVWQRQSGPYYAS